MHCCVQGVSSVAPCSLPVHAAVRFDGFREFVHVVEIAHFFEHYKDLDEGKWVRVEGWGDIEEAKEEIMISVAMYKEAPVKPNF